jgi:ribonuclease HIII
MLGSTLPLGKSKEVKTITKKIKTRITAHELIRIHK